MLEARNVRSGYGEITILKDLSFTVGREVFAVLGANGAGKSTLLKTLAGLVPLTAGEIRFDGLPVAGRTAYQRAEMGISYVPQERSVFADLTVAENLSIGALVGRRSRKERLEEVFDLFPDLRDRLNQKAGSLSGGEGQMAAVGRALMQEPRLLLLDEPTAGLSPLYRDLLFRRIAEICAEKQVAVVLAEQNAVKTIEVAHRVMILGLGESHLTGEAEKISIDKVKEGYRI